MQRHSPLPREGGQSHMLVSITVRSRIAEELLTSNWFVLISQVLALKEALWNQGGGQSQRHAHPSAPNKHHL